MAGKWFGARGVIGSLAVLGLIGLGAFWLVTITVDHSSLSADAGLLARPRQWRDDVHHRRLRSCHKTVGQGDRLKLGGGVGLRSPFGTFYAPNVSTDKTHGIGGWSELAFVNALMRGVGEDGEHLYPALPYTSYQRMRLEDVRDLWAYMKTLPATADASKPHDVPFPFNIRRALGGWKFLFMDDRPFVADPSKDVVWNRGAYLVEGPGHCAECHSPRNALGGIKADERFAGGVDVESGGWIPNITPHADGIGDWSEADVAEFLKTGFTPEFDSAGGGMAEVIRNTSRLSDEDRVAIAKYIASLPARPGKAPPRAGSSTP